MTLGEKIKEARLKKKMTQAALTKDKITRNMLSAIESGKASPSLDTLCFLAKELDIPLPYLLSDDDDLFVYQKNESIGAIRSALGKRNYTVCINLCLRLERIDDELAYILASCYFELGTTAVRNGALQSAEKHLELCKHYCEKTIYDTSRFIGIMPIYTAICRNVNSPLLEFEEEEYIESLRGSFDYEFYRYLVLDYSYEYRQPQYGAHIRAKQLIKERRYTEAIGLLLDIERNKGKYTPNAFLMFGVYGDLDSCYRQLLDFENAYRYASKRISLLEGFQT